MKTIPYSRYNMEFLGRGAKPELVWYNPDNSVVVLGESERNIYEWVSARAEKLRESKFFLNDETAGKIREWIDQNGTTGTESPEGIIPETTPVLTAEDTKQFETPKVLGTVEQIAASRSRARDEILKELDNKLTVAQLRDVVKKLAGII